MPAISPNANKKVLVTGANGYIAMWIIKFLLERGYSVRGSVRSQEKGVQMGKYFDEKTYGDRIEWVVVPKLEQTDAFNDAVKDVDAVIHTASPLPEASDDPNDLIIPAVEGTANLLQSAFQNGDKISRVVLTSSCATIIGVVEEGRMTTFDERNWNDVSVKIVSEQGKNAPAIVKYRASKTLAEKAAWQFYNAHLAQLPFDMVTLHPPLVVGPPLQDLESPEKFGSSMLTWFNNVMRENSDKTLQGCYSYIDVRDAAMAHVIALEKPDAGGERIIISEGATTWQETRNLIHKLRPELRDSGIIPKGNPNLDNAINFGYNAAKSKQVLGIKYRDYEETLADTLSDLEKRGWLVGQGPVSEK